MYVYIIYAYTNTWVLIFLCGDYIDIVIFIMYKLHIISFNPNHHRKLSALLHLKKIKIKKKSSGMIYDLVDQKNIFPIT